ncbi:sugar transferase [Paractinoplanes deccanensis]|uniref:Sugar transferase n=1 Tax=Paractinoplanes deccanensis TaxID=113561 RepID=A0ABQ3YKJ7_9ACTN|nr:sugar transferase [Actinoplanes deccanensis]GID80521.1 sugar transferase [Actinoplanes deccanensis]
MIARLLSPAARYELAKRVVDIAGAAGILLATAPITAYAAWRIKREDGGPLLYRGERIGRHGKPFAMLKFRSMVLDAERLGGPSTADDDPRLTATGRMLRRWKIDELPQFVNVLTGEMSLVGPRPQVASDVRRYTERERRLLSVKPGITDWASIAFRDEGAILAGKPDPDAAYDELIRPRKIELGLLYVETRGLVTDLRILLITALAVAGVDRVDEMIPPAGVPAHA